MLVAGTATVAGVSVLGITGSLGDVARAVGVRPRSRPDPADVSLLHAVVTDQQRVLSVVRADSTDRTVVALLESQLRGLGATPGTGSRSGDAAAVLTQAAGYRAEDAVAARSPQLAQLLASMSAGLDLAADLIRKGS